MTTSTPKADKMTTADQLNQSELAKKFGFEFIPDDKVPAPARPRESDTERWEAIKTVLTTTAPNQWAMVKVCSKAGSAGNISSRINGGGFRAFPSEKGWEARHEVTRKKGENGKDDEGESKLFVRFNKVEEETKPEPKAEETPKPNKR